MTHIREEAFKNIDIPNDCDDECDYLIRIIDPFGCGDSMTEYECSCTDYNDCPIIEGMN